MLSVAESYWYKRIIEGAIPHFRPLQGAIFENFPTPKPPTTEMEPEPCEALDLEVEDRPLLFPCKRKNSISPTNPFHLGPCSLNSRSEFHSIPGPAGAVQSAMHRKILMGFGGDDPLPTQEYIRRAVEDPDHPDDDFSRHPWLLAVDFIRRHGLVGSDGVAIGTPLSYVKTGVNMDKVSQIVAIVKSSTPNGLGDMMVTLKDPTGTIDASIHRRVFTESDFGKDISVGAVLILQKVAIFSPSRSACYLNITLSNIVKVFAISKDCGTASKQNHPAFMVKDASTTVESREQTWTLPKTFSQSQERTEGILNCHRQNADVRGSAHSEKQMEKVSASISSRFCGLGDSRNGNSDGKESSSVSQVAVDGRKEVDTGTDVNEQSWMPLRTFSQSQGRTDGILSSLRQNANVRESAHNGKQMDKANQSVPSLFCGGDRRNQNSDGEKEPFSVSLDVDGKKEIAVQTGRNVNEQSSHSNQAGKSNLSSKCGLSIAADIPNSEEENGNTKRVEKHRQLLISRGTLPEWTDEQLDELLSFD